jgi:hypothetical protein
MPEVVIRLERPATLTPELRAWISHRFGPSRALLSRSRSEGPGESTLLLRVRIDAESPRKLEEEIGDLLTDLRLLGLSPTLLQGNLAGETASGAPAAA